MFDRKKSPNNSKDGARTKKLNKLGLFSKHKIEKP